MIKDKEVLLQKIEQTRIEMIDLADSHGYTSEKTLKLSKHLDGLLNDYQKKELQDKKVHK